MSNDDEDTYSAGFGHLRKRLLSCEEEIDISGSMSEPNPNFTMQPQLTKGYARSSLPFYFDEQAQEEEKLKHNALMYKSPIRTRSRTAGQRAGRAGKFPHRIIEDAGPATGVIVALCIGEALDLRRIAEDWGSSTARERRRTELRGSHSTNNVVPTTCVSLDSEVALLRVFGERDVFLFRFGCCVSWSLTDVLLEQVRCFLEPYVIIPLQPSLIEQDEMLYTNGAIASIRKDLVVLSSHNAFERMAHSYAFAQSVRLTVYESSVDATIAKTKSIPEEMVKTGRLPKNMNAVATSKQMGELFVLRCHVNLHTDILDTPEIFWEFDEYEEHYEKCRKYLDINKRVGILNQRLEIVKELYDMLQNEVQVEHANFLEWVVILLILMEIILDLGRLFLDYALPGTFHD